MNVPELERTLQRHFTEHHAAWQLDPRRLRVVYVDNAGGFVNHSFFVSDGRTRLHVKTSPKSDDADLRRWMSLADYLSRHYHAPAAKGWLELAEVRMAGIAFERLDGVVPRGWSEAPLAEVCDVIGRLHADGELLARLGRDRPLTCRDVYLETYGDRFRENLSFLETDRPPFLDRSTFDQMRDESRALWAWVEASEDFRHPAGSPIHSDLWPGNVLLDRTGWYLLDWDDLRIGDPALDIALLGGPGERSSPTFFEPGGRHRVAWGGNPRTVESPCPWPEPTHLSTTSSSAPARPAACWPTG